MIVEEARTWLGTPFLPHAQVKGSGVDCAHLAKAIYSVVNEKAAGVRLPRYTMDGGDHLAEPYIEKFIHEAGFVKCDGVPLPGDLVTFKLGRISYHMGVMVTDLTFIHAIRGFGVIESRIDDSTYSKRITGVYHLP